MVDPMEVTPLGDYALIVRVCERLGDVSLQQVLQTLSRLENAHIPGIIEMAPAYTTIAVFYDPIRVIEAGAHLKSIPQWLTERFRKALTTGSEIPDHPVEPRHLVIPVCYGGEYGPDLNEVSRHTGLSTEEIIHRHSAAEYLVHCIGFSPGFAYLGGLPPELATPRRAVPRKQVPSGSVAIGGVQSGVYPIASPGGWHLIGRTPLRLFSVDTDPPTLLRAGDHVRFRAINPEEFESWME
jgi:inhibitor of KinA